MIEIPLKEKYRPGSGGFKGISRKKSDDRPGMAVRTGTRKFTGRTIPDRNRQHRVPQQPAGFPRGRKKGAK